MSNYTPHTQTQSGIGFSGLLTIAFITLKLIGAIAWSWWWIFSPLWIPVVVFFIIIALCLGLVWFCSSGEKR